MQTLEIPFEEHLEQFDGVGSTSTFVNFSPSGKVPCLHDGQLRLWDSLAITEYLAESHPLVWPATLEARAWARCASAEMHSGFSVLRNHCPMSCGLRVQLRNTPKALHRDIERIENLWHEGHTLFGGPYLAGSAFTAVDAFFAPVIFRFQTYGLPLSNIAQKYVAHMLGLPAMKSWYNAALKETWRETEYETEVQALALKITDLRKG